MKYWTTSIKAIHPTTGELVCWMGPYIPADTREQAEKHCNENGLGYCKVDVEFETELPFDVLEGLKNFSENLKYK